MTGSQHGAKHSTTHRDDRGPEGRFETLRPDSLQIPTVADDGVNASVTWVTGGQFRAGWCGSVTRVSRILVVSAVTENGFWMK